MSYCVPYNAVFVPIFREQELGSRDHQATLEHSLVTLILISILDITKTSSNNCIKSVSRINCESYLLFHFLYKQVLGTCGQTLDTKPWPTQAKNTIFIIVSVCKRKFDLSRP